MYIYIYIFICTNTSSHHYIYYGKYIYVHFMYIIYIYIFLGCLGLVLSLKIHKRHLENHFDFHLRSAQISVIAYMLLSYGISYYCLSNYSIVGGSHRQTYFHIAFCRYCKWANI